ncbi:hypothetical protein BJ912DRAFT_947063 [Pholiota molesta]|nr:hypothetical protein BJ912DRAFT_947063 [Pholiota molesta]
MSDVLAHFGCLDELTQVIYQGVYKFVVLSTVSDDVWTVHVGLSGHQGRWWHGSWSEDDIHENFGSKLSDILLEACAEKLANLFIQGEICISDWSPEKGANIKLTFGPTSKKPMQIALVEMSTEEAAAYATKVFIDIALQAQSRKCRLYPSAADYPTLPPVNAPPSASSLKRKERSPEIQSGLTERKAVGTKHKHFETQKSSAAPSDTKVIPAAKNHQLKPELQPKSGTSGSSGSSQTQPTNVVRRPKGASLANPTKKARKYQAIEFESDEE